MEPGDTLHQHLPERGQVNTGQLMLKKTVAQKVCPVMGRAC